MHPKVVQTYKLDLNRADAADAALPGDVDVVNGNAQPQRGKGKQCKPGKRRDVQLLNDR